MGWDTGTCSAMRDNPSARFNADGTTDRSLELDRMYRIGPSRPPSC